MTTVLQYLVIAAVIGLALFGLSLVLFGRGERLSALPARTSPATLPDTDVTGQDVRKVRFALAVRGYRMSDVDWTLDRLADELDRTRELLTAARLHGAEQLSDQEAEQIDNHAPQYPSTDAVANAEDPSPDGSDPELSSTSSSSLTHFTHSQD